MSYPHTIIFLFFCLVSAFSQNSPQPLQNNTALFVNKQTITKAQIFDFFVVRYKKLAEMAIISSIPLILEDSADSTKVRLKVSKTARELSKMRLFYVILKNYPKQMGEVIRELTMRVIIRSEAKKEKVNVARQEVIKLYKKEMKQLKTEVKNRLKISWEKYLELRGITEKKIKQETFLKKKYSLSLHHLIKLSQLRQTHMQLRHIMVKNRRKAQTVLKKLKSQADFTVLARQESREKRTKSSYLIVYKNDLLPEIEKEIWQLRPGQYSKVIKSRPGLFREDIMAFAGKKGSYFHIFQITEKKIGQKNAKWESLKDTITAQLSKESILEKELQRWLDQMNKKYKITRKF